MLQRLRNIGPGIVIAATGLGAAAGCQHSAATPTKRAQRAELVRALKDAHQHGVHHSHPTNDHREQRDAPREPLQVGQHILLLHFFHIGFADLIHLT